MKSPTVALVCILFACQLPAQAEEHRNSSLSAEIAALITGVRKVVKTSQPASPGDAVPEALAPDRIDKIETLPATTPSANALSRDVRPFGNSFFLGGGTYSGSRQAGFGTNPTRSNTGAQVLALPEFGRPETQTEYQDTVPFVGGGFNTSFTAKGQWDVKVMAGAAFFGPADNRASSSRASLSNAGAFDQEIRNKDVAPLVQVGLTYRF